jgi:hypothetical protein
LFAVPEPVQDGTLQELVSTGTTTLQQLTEEDLAHLATLPRIKKRKNLSSMLLEASGGLICRYIDFSLLQVRFHWGAILGAHLYCTTEILIL